MKLTGFYIIAKKKNIDERVLQKTARQGGIKEGELKKAIEDVVNLVSATKMSIHEAQIKKELNKQGIKYQE